MRLSALYFFIIGGAITLNSCKKENTNTSYTTSKGPEVEVGEGRAQTFITISIAGVPKEIGVIFTDDALTGLPDENALYSLKLPAKAIEATPFEHAVAGLSHGHGLPPSGSIAPHFDVRFFMITNEERLAIPAPPAPGFDVYPPSGYLPAGHVPYSTAQQIGRHWPSGSFTADQVVNHTMVWGTYNGQVIFISPIVTLTTLGSGMSYSVAYSQPQYFAKHGYYPTKYNIYKDDKGSHYVTLSDFVWR